MWLLLQLLLFAVSASYSNLLTVMQRDSVIPLCGQAQLCSFSSAVPSA